MHLEWHLSHFHPNKSFCYRDQVLNLRACVCVDHFLKKKNPLFIHVLFSTQPLVYMNVDTYSCPLQAPCEHLGVNLLKGTSAVLWKCPGSCPATKPQYVCIQYANKVAKAVHRSAQTFSINDVSICESKIQSVQKRLCLSTVPKNDFRALERMARL